MPTFDEKIHRYQVAKGYFNSVFMLLSSPHRKGAHVEGTILPMLMLSGFALELYFKAWLLQAGRPSDEVRGYGHKIKRLFKEAKAGGLPEIPGLDEIVKAIGPGHEQLMFRYIEEGQSIPLMVWENVLPVLNTLDTEVDTFIGASASMGLQPGH